jgi:protein-tyrosine phosphatase
MIDLHCHILPGLDDGAESLAESLAMARVAQAEGIQVIVATPHLFRGDIGLADLAAVGRKKQELETALKQAGLPLKILSGVEVRFSHNLIEEIKRNKRALVIHTSSHMFIEFPFDYVYSGVKEVFFELMSEGIIPIIAHPERNSVFINHPGQLYDLVEMGCLSQANSGSFTGLYGQVVRETVTRLVSWGLVHVLGSDAHNSTSRAPHFKEALRIIESIIGPEAARALVVDNPRAVLEDKSLPYLPEPVNPAPKEKSFKIKLPSFSFNKRKDHAD